MTNNSNGSSKHNNMESMLHEKGRNSSIGALDLPLSGHIGLGKSLSAQGPNLPTFRLGDKII